MIGQWMKRDVVFVSPHTTVLEAARLIVDRHVGTLPVVDEQASLVGIVRVEDILETFMPDFVRLMADFDFVRDFGVLESLMPRDAPGVAQRTMRDLMQEPVAVEQTSGLLRSLAVMTKHNIRDLPSSTRPARGRHRVVGGYRHSLPGLLDRGRRRPMTLAQVITALIFLLTFAAIMAERVHRTIVAMLGAAVMLIVGMLMGFYSQGQALAAIDFNTLGLLFGMMILVRYSNRPASSNTSRSASASVPAGDPGCCCSSWAARRPCSRCSWTK